MIYGSSRGVKIQILLHHVAVDFVIVVALKWLVIAIIILACRGKELLANKTPKG